MKKNNAKPAACVIHLTMALVMVAISTPGVAATIEFELPFSADQSLWQGGPSGGFDRSGTLGSSAGITYRAVANTGTVTASVNGALEVQHPDVLSQNTAATINFRYRGESGGGSLNSTLGASVTVNGFIPCVVSNPFTGTCLHPRTFPLFNAGLLLEPATTFTPVIDATASGSDVANATGVGPNISFPFVGELGAAVNLDLAQSVQLTPTSINGLLRYENRNTGAMGTMPLTLDNNSTVQLTTHSLGVGIWDFEILEIDLNNVFRNDVNLDLRPTINYVIGSWPPPGSPLFSIGLIDQTFALQFGSRSLVDAFTIVVAPDCDFDGVNGCDMNDIDSLVTEVVAGTHDPTFDVNGDGLVTSADINAPNFGWLRLAGEQNLGPGRAYLEGDSDLNGVVDGSDFNAWNAEKFTMTAAWTQGDFNADGWTDGADFNVWNSNKFMSALQPASRGATVSANMVPEPVAFLWLALGACFMTNSRRIGR